MARGEVTISVHNGTDVATDHNLRVPEVCEHEPHIDPNGIHETWLHEDLREFYNRTFKASQVEYDNKARACRRIGDYLDSITREAVAAEEANAEIRERNKAHKEAGEKLEKLKVARKPVYEIIAGIYPQGDLELTEQESRDALHLWVFGDGTDEHKSWEERHPGLKLVGVYYHADEPGARPHVHLDYVPVAECSRGMRLQNSLEGALNAEGKVSAKVKCADGKERLKMAQEQFTDAERDGLQAICEEMGLSVIHPMRGKKTRHKSTDEKKRETQAANLDAARASVVAELEARKAEIERGLQAQATALDEREQDLTERETAVTQKEKDLAEREQTLTEKETAVDDMKKRLNGRELSVSSREDKVKAREAAVTVREEGLDEVERAALEARKKIENSPAYLNMWRENFKQKVEVGYHKMVQDGSYFELGQ